MQITKTYLPFKVCGLEFHGLNLKNSEINLCEVTAISGQFIVNEYNICYDVTDDSSPRCQHELLIPVDPTIYGPGFVLDVDSNGPAHVVEWLRANVNQIVRAHIALSEVGRSAY